jgi:hypothetical protein
LSICGRGLNISCIVFRVRNKQKETIHILGTILEQNYFQVDQEYYKQTDGLAMGAPTSSLLTETYIQYMEHTQLYPILVQQQIIAYYRYVDDILIIYDQNRTNIVIGSINRSTERKLALVLLSPAQNPHDLTWDRIRAASVGSRRITA